MTRPLRVAERVHVAHRARDRARGALEDVAAGRGVEVAGCPGPDPVVAALVDQRRQVAHLELEPRDDEEVGAVEFQHERRLRLDEVRILVTPGERLRVDALAADRLRERAEIRQRRDDLQLLRFGGGRKQKRRE
jgi:hypothetical protein